MVAVELLAVPLVRLAAPDEALSTVVELDFPATARTRTADQPVTRYRAPEILGVAALDHAAQVEPGSALRRDKLGVADRAPRVAVSAVLCLVEVEDLVDRERPGEVPDDL